MEALNSFVASSPIISVVILVLIVTLILYFTFKSLSKFVMILFVIFVVGLGYYYYQDPEKVRDSCISMLSSVMDLSEKRKTFVQDSQDVLKKTKEAPGQVTKMLDASKKELNK
jgi:hypothetical protein